MPISNTFKYISGIVAILFFITLYGCSKQDYRPGYAVGTTFPTIHLNGFTLDRMQVHVGPKSVVAGEIFEEVSDKTFEVPFAASLDVNRVVFYNEDNTAPYTGSQIRFETPTKDTSVKIFYDGKTFFQNPVFPLPTVGKMGIRVNFKTLYSQYKGPIDLELHEIYDTKVTKINPETGKPYRDTIKNKDILFDTIFVKPAVAMVIHNLKSSEFNEYSEINAPITPRINKPGEDPKAKLYAFYIRKANTTEPLPYPANVTPPSTDYMAQPSEFIEFVQDHTTILTIKDNRLVLEKPNRINYKVDDRAQLFN